MSWLIFQISHKYKNHQLKKNISLLLKIILVVLMFRLGKRNKKFVFLVIQNIHFFFSLQGIGGTLMKLKEI